MSPRQNKGGKQGGGGGGKDWKGWPVSATSKKVKVDWACFECDDSTPQYLGNYANEDYCRDCNVHKRLRHHMTMEVRAWHLEQGTLQTRAARLEQREINKANKDGGNFTPTQEEDLVEIVFQEQREGKFNTHDEFIAAFYAATAAKEGALKAAEEQAGGVPVGAVTANGQGVTAGPGQPAPAKYDPTILADII